MLARTRTLTSWNLFTRSLVFTLAATSIGCLLAEFYGICSMRMFTLRIFLPACLLLTTWSIFDFFSGRRELLRAVIIGASAGLIAAIVYDLFRLPFVYARQWGIDFVFPQLNLFKVFPRFGAMILGQAVEQTHYSTFAQWLGWSYHFSNGIAFGVMYMALIGDGRRHWAWGVVMALGLEIGLLFSGYTKVFGIPLTETFVFVTLAAHLIFGAALGLSARWFSRPFKTSETF
ncbi:MAG: hypothetical protein ABI042_03395 [Verrucomicrobiota bacterium]